MRSYEEIEKDARDESPFSNSTEGDTWLAQWCDRCQHPAEKGWRSFEAGTRKTAPKDYPGGCPLLMVALTGKTPLEWFEQDRCRLGDQYHCIEFKGPDNGRGGRGGGEPRPKPEPPGMDGLFERPERGRRMLIQPQTRELVSV